MIKIFSNISAAMIGYFSAPSVMLSIGLSQGVMDEAARAVMGLLIAIISRIVFGKIETRSKTRKERKRIHIKPEQKPESITLNSKINGKEISEQLKSSQS